MLRFLPFTKIVLILLLLATGCTLSQGAKSTPETTPRPLAVAGTVQSVSLSAKVVFLSEPTMGIETIAVTEQTQLADSLGNPITLREIQPGQSVQATGEAHEDSLLAIQVTVQVHPTQNETPKSELSATLEVPSHLPTGETVVLTFTLTNHSEVDLYVLKWFTPLEGLGGEIFRVKRDGQVIPYEGPLAERADPTPDAYVFLEAGASVSATVDLARAYDFSERGGYTIAFISPRISHVARSEGEMATSVDDLGPVAMPSNQVTVTITADLASGEAETMGYILDLYEQGGHWHTSFDQVEWLTGADAVKAIVEDGLCATSGSDCEPPNGFYIRNRDERPISLPLSEKVTILMQTLSHAPDGNSNWDEPIGLDRFRQELDENSASHLRGVPYRITVDGGAVTVIREQYVP
jgi:hypothetical protein